MTCSSFSVLPPVVQLRMVDFQIAVSSGCRFWNASQRVILVMKFLVFMCCMENTHQLLLFRSLVFLELLWGQGASWHIGEDFYWMPPVQVTGFSFLFVSAPFSWFCCECHSCQELLSHFPYFLVWFVILHCFLHNLIASLNRLEALCLNVTSDALNNCSFWNEESEI